MKDKEYLKAYRQRPEVKLKLRKARRARTATGKEAAERKALKLEVLSHYGVDGKAQCRWVGCTVDDLDMLSLDHINNDGCKQRREHSRNAYGHWFYAQAKKTWPTDLQTLCMNHQFKKRALRSVSEQGRPKMLDIGL